jgi:hypothetical protein
MISHLFSRSFLAVLFFTLSFGLTAFAQPKFNSPYSRFGLGDLSVPTLAQHTAMGGVSIGYADPLHLNTNNPAALGNLDMTAFEGGFYVKNSSYKSRSQSNQSLSGNMSYLGLGFTMRNVINETLEKVKPKYKIGMGFFLEPVSAIGYDVTSVDTISTDQVIINQYQGDGGYYRFKYGIGARRKNTSAGLFLGWQFGKATFENTTLFDTLPSFQNNFRDEVFMRGFVYSLGVQHDVVLKRNENNKEIATRWITFGATANPAKSIGISATQLRQRSRGRTANGAQYIDADTLKYVEGESKRISLPTEIGIGLMYNQLNKVRLGLDVKYTAWSKYLNPVRPDNLANCLSVSAGGEYIPDHISYNKYLRRIKYRFGAYYRQDPRVVAGKQLTDTGVSVGFGLPLILPRQQASAIHLSLELGQIGGNASIKENYWRATMAYTFNDNSWFFKRRFE